MPESNTRLEIEAEVLRILAQRDPEDSMLQVPTFGNISAASTITLPSTDRGTINANRYDGRLIKVAEDVLAVNYSPAVVIGAAVSATAELITVNDTSAMRAGDVVLVNGGENERMLVRGIISATVFAADRGVHGTTAVAYSGTETVQYMVLGAITGVDDGGLAAGGILTISPNFPGTGWQASKFHVYPKGLSPDIVVGAIQRVLAHTEGPHLWVPSLVEDADFEENDLTNWAAVNTPTTREFVTTAADILYGSRALHLDGADDGEGAVSNNFDVTEEETLSVLVYVRVISGSVEVVLRNSTAATDMRAVTGLTDRLYQAVWFTEAVAADCEQAALRFLGESTDSEWYVSPYVTVQSQSRRRYSVPSWWTREDQLMETVQIVPGYPSAETQYSYIALDERHYPKLGTTFLRSDRDANPMRVEFACPGSYPVGFMVMRPFGELSWDLATTYADKYFVAQKAVSLILRDRGDAEWRFWAQQAAKKATILGYGQTQVVSEEARTYV